jgi:hypothetical protein
VSASARLLAALLAILLVAATVAACGGGSDGSGDGDASGMASNGGGGGGDEEPEEEIDEQPEANNQVYLGAAFFGEQPAQFGAVALGESRTLGFAVTSLSYTRTIQSVSIGGDHPGDFSLDPGSCTTGTVVGEGASCTLSITFTPTADGVRKAALDIEIDPGVSGGRSLEGGGGSEPPPTTTTEVQPTDTAPVETNAETAAPPP